MKIISNARNEETLGIRKKKNGNYYELHHILPKCLFPLWVDRKSNKVLLTAREHFFCHQLLTKIFENSKLYYAAWRLSTDHKHKITSREYKRIKEKISKINSEELSNEGNPMFGRSAFMEMDETHKQEYIQKMRKSCKEVEKTDEWCKHISEALKGKPKSESHKAKLKESFQNRKEDFIRAGAEWHKGKHWYNDGKKNILAEKCPEGFIKGKIEKPQNEDVKKRANIKRAKAFVGRHWYNDGIKNYFLYEKPEGCVEGKLHKKYKIKDGENDY